MSQIIRRLGPSTSSPGQIVLTATGNKVNTAPFNVVIRNIMSLLTFALRMEPMSSRNFRYPLKKLHGVSPIVLYLVLSRAILPKYLSERKIFRAKLVQMNESHVGCQVHFFSFKVSSSVFKIIKHERAKALCSMHIFLAAFFCSFCAKHLSLRWILLSRHTQKRKWILI